MGHVRLSAVLTTRQQADSRPDPGGRDADKHDIADAREFSTAIRFSQVRPEASLGRLSLTLFERAMERASWKRRGAPRSTTSGRISVRVGSSDAEVKPAGPSPIITACLPKFIERSPSFTKFASAHPGITLSSGVFRMIESLSPTGKRRRTERLGAARRSALRRLECPEISLSQVKERQGDDPVDREHDDSFQPIRFAVLTDNRKNHDGYGNDDRLHEGEVQIQRR